MNRPTDWTPLRNEDPLPGDPWELNRLARHFASVDEVMTTQVSRLEGFAGGQAQVGLSVDALQARASDLVDKLSAGSTRFSTASQVLASYGTTLGRCQDDASAALARAQEAHARAQAAARLLTSLVAPEGDETPDGAAATLRAEQRSAQTAWDSAADDIARESRLLDGIEDERDAAARTAQREIAAAIDKDGLDDRWWDSQVLRDISGALGEVAWQAGPGLITDLMELAAWLTPGEWDDEQVQRFSQWVDGGHDHLQDAWGTDPTSEAFQITFWGLNAGLVLAGGYGLARLVPRLVVGGLKVSRAELAGEGVRRALTELLPWIPVPLSGEELDGHGYLQGPGYVRGPLGDDFGPGVVDPFGAFSPQERETAEWLAEHDGAAVHPRQQHDGAGQNPDAMVRRDDEDGGTVVELKTPTSASDNALKAKIHDASGQVLAWGGGEVVVDGRSTGTTREQAARAVQREWDQVAGRGESWKFPEKVTIVLADGSALEVTREELLASGKVAA